MVFPSSIADLSSTVKRLALAAGLLASAALFAPGPASADALSGHHHHARHATRAERAESVEQRIASLHAALKITPEEETNWSAVAQVMRGNEAKMQDLISARKAQPTHDMDAVEDLKAYEQFTQTHVDGLKVLISSFEILYNTMPDDQKHVADQVFQKFAHRRESRG